MSGNSNVPGGGFEIAYNNGYLFSNAQVNDFIIHTVTPDQRLLLGAASNGSAALVITSNAVGINTSNSPQYTLDVGGTLNVSGGITMAGNAVTFSKWSSNNTGSNIYRTEGRVAIGSNTHPELFSVQNGNAFFGSNITVQNQVLVGANAPALASSNTSLAVDGNITTSRPFSMQGLFIKRNPNAAATTSISMAVPNIDTTGSNMTLTIKGSTANNAFTFLTGGSNTVAVLTGTGTLGIGLSNPSAATRLHVKGDARIEGNLTVNGISTIVNTDVSTTERLDITNDGTGPALRVTQLGAQPIADFYDDSNVLALRIADGGAVGVGTSNPTNLLAVAGNVSVGAAYSNVAAPTNGLIIQGSVGVGLSNPSSALHVAGAVTATQGLLGNATTATTLQTARTINGVAFDGSANIALTASNPYALSNGAYITGSNYSGATAVTWAVNATDNNTANTVVARDASGNFSAGLVTANLNASTVSTSNLAIGHSNAAYPLHVKGDARIEGNLALARNTVSYSNNAVIGLGFGGGVGAGTAYSWAISNIVLNRDNGAGPNYDYGAQGHLVFFTKANNLYSGGVSDQQYTEVLRLAHTGAVGINTSNPIRHFHGTGEFSWTPGSVNNNTAIFNVNDANGNGGSNISVLWRGLATGGSAGQQMKSFTIDAVDTYITGNIQTSVLTGAIMYFAKSTAPIGWLKCNGATISRTTYADLFTAIGTTFGVGDGSTTFKIPDLRGEFVRGWDDSRGIDTTGGARTFGSFQKATIMTFNTPYNEGYVETLVASADTDTNNGRIAVGADPAVIGDYSNTGKCYNGPGFTTSSAPFDWINTANYGGGAVRPRNVALLACIKY